MKLKSTMLSLLGLGLVGWLALGVSSASAQSVYFETYAQPYPVVEPYPVVVAPRYVVRPAVVAAPVVRERTVVVRRPAVVAAPVVRERTLIVSRPAYVPAPLLGPPMPPPYLVADW